MTTTNKLKKAINTLKLNDRALDAKVHIQGTPYDRKRKYDAKTVGKMKRMFNKGKSFYAIAKELGCDSKTVRYNLDPEYKAWFNANRDGKHTGKDSITFANRVQYKRALVAECKI